MDVRINISKPLLTWYNKHGRKNLPWQHDITPYRVWLSEIMLQQTQVATVIPYFQRFTERFSDINRLANAPLDDVLHLWAGLGYYSRARNLHKTAQIIVNDYRGQFPDNLATLQQLPGIGRSTAGAILAIAFKQHAAILDGNVKRVLTRLHAIDGWPGNTQVQKHLWQLAEHYTPSKNTADYTQAIMDLGATLCTRGKPQCTSCPLAKQCQAYQNNTVNNYPNPKPRKTLPIRTIQWMIIENHQQHVLLEQRPPLGIWGGLWSFPECTSDMPTHVWLQQHNLTAEHLKTGQSFRHTFSHFHLDITPIHIYITQPTPLAIANNSIIWYKYNSSKKLGLAAPVSKLLKATYG